MNRYTVVFERANANLSAYVPDLPGCVATGRTEEEVKTNIAEAMKLHLDVMRQHNETIPTASTVADVVEVE